MPEFECYIYTHIQMHIPKGTITLQSFCKNLFEIYSFKKIAIAMKIAIANLLIVLIINEGHFFVGVLIAFLIEGAHISLTFERDHFFHAMFC